MNDRDTKFQGFAERLVLEIDGNAIRYKDWPDWKELDRQVKLIIARRAYDLVQHTYKHVSHINLDRLTLEEQIATIPDLTEWPS